MDVVISSRKFIFIIINKLFIYDSNYSNEDNVYHDVPHRKVNVERCEWENKGYYLRLLYLNDLVYNSY